MDPGPLHPRNRSRVSNQYHGMRFFHGGANELAMRSETQGPFSLYLTSDSGIVAVESEDRFWGDSGVRDRVFLTISEYPPSPPAL